SLTRAEDNSYIDVNEAFERATGWPRDQIIGRTPFELGIWANPEQRRNLQRSVIAGTGVQNLEFSLRNRAGEIRTGLGSSELIEIDGTQCILSVASDITERKQLEEKIQRALREGEERFRVVANRAPVMIWMSGEDKLRIYLNQRWLEFTGRPQAAELG